MFRLNRIIFNQKPGQWRKRKMKWYAFAHNTDSIQMDLFAVNNCIFILTLEFFPNGVQEQKKYFFGFKVTRSLTRALQIVGISPTFEPLPTLERTHRRRNTHVERSLPIVAAKRSRRFNTMPSRFCFLNIHFDLIDLWKHFTFITYRSW